MKQSNICKLCKLQTCISTTVISKCKEYGRIKRHIEKQRKNENERESLRVSDTQFKCKNPKCDKLHNGEYASGLFCSKHCACQYAILVNGNSEKLRRHRRSLYEKHILKTIKRSPYGTWKCKICGEIFESRRLMFLHYKQTNHGSNNPICKDNGTYECPYCKKVFLKKGSANGHVFQCKMSPFYDKDKDIERHEKSASRLKERYAKGEIRISDRKNVSTETRIKLREAALRYLKRTVGCSHRYNKNSIPILESIAKEHGWNLQHAENGGEFYTGIGFYVDGYDKEKNIVVEYDEKDHYRDYRNNILRDKDIERQREIIEHLHCEFYRYNEATGILWKVEIKNEDLHKSSA